MYNILDDERPNKYKPNIRNLLLATPMYQFYQRESTPFQSIQQYGDTQNYRRHAQIPTFQQNPNGLGDCQFSCARPTSANERYPFRTRYQGEFQILHPISNCSRKWDR